MTPIRRPSQTADTDDLYARVIALERALAASAPCIEEDWHIVDDPGEPPFENGWGNVGGSEAPVSFAKDCDGWIHIRGGFEGGVASTVVFTLPVGYRPDYQQPAVIPTTSPTNFATVIIGTNGEVLYLDTV